METVFYVIGTTGVVAVVILATVLFGVPSWTGPDRKPDKETVYIIAVILGLMVLVVMGAILWGVITKST